MAKKRKTNGYLKQSFTFEGKRIYVRGKTPKELAEKLLKKREELENGVQDLYNPTLNAYYEHFTDIRRTEIKESTLRSQRIQFEVVAGVLLANGIKIGDMRIKTITRRNIEDARQILLNNGKTPQYINNCFAHVNHVFNKAVLDDTIDKNPCKALTPLKRIAPLVADTKHRALTEQETKRFFEVAAERNSYYINAFLVMIKSGLRIGELTALYRSDIDHKNGFIHVRRTIARNEVGGYIVGDNAKTKSGMRDIPLTDEVFNIIKEQESLNRMIFGLEINGLLFKSAEGHILREYTLNREIKRICKAAGIEEFTCHAFRNTFATRFIEQRPQDYKILSEILGHKDVSITLNLYTHVMTDKKVEAMQEIMIKTS